MREALEAAVHEAGIPEILQADSAGIVIVFWMVIYNFIIFKCNATANANASVN